MNQLFLAILARSNGRFVRTNALVDELWPDLPETVMPKEPRQRLWEIAAGLRGALRKLHVDDIAVLPKVRDGYQLLIEKSSVDLNRFTDLVRDANAKAGSDDHEAAKLFRSAFRQWDPEGTPDRTEPFAGLCGPWVELERTQLNNVYRSAYVACIEAELRLGLHHQILPELAQRCDAAPLDEELTSLRMRTLHGAGRTSEALEAFDLIRRRINDDIGVDPGVGIRELHQSILRQDPNLSLAASGQPLPQPLTPVREEKPVATNEFKAVTKGHATVGVQATEFSGNYYANGMRPSALERQAARLSDALQQALPTDAAKKARAGVRQAVSCLDDPHGPDYAEFESIMKGVRSMVDGADDLVDVIDAFISEGRRDRS